MQGGVLRTFLTRSPEVLREREHSRWGVRSMHHPHTRAPRTGLHARAFAWLIAGPDSGSCLHLPAEGRFSECAPGCSDREHQRSRPAAGSWLRREPSAVRAVVPWKQGGGSSLPTLGRKRSPLTRAPPAVGPKPVSQSNPAPAGETPQELRGGPAAVSLGAESGGLALSPSARPCGNRPALC